MLDNALEWYNAHHVLWNTNFVFMLVR
jgi:hypothetical protein